VNLTHLVAGGDAGVVVAAEFRDGVAEQREDATCELEVAAAGGADAADVEVLLAVERDVGILLGLGGSSPVAGFEQEPCADGVQAAALSAVALGRGGFGSTRSRAWARWPFWRWP
jgi:hypothetical protein